MYSIQIVKATSLDVPKVDPKTYLLNKAKYLIRKYMALDLSELVFGDYRFALRASEILKSNRIRNMVIIS